MFAGDDKRPPIPAGLRRRVLVESGHRCAIPTCRYIEVELHHINPWAKCRSHDYNNLIALCPNCHNRADRNEIDRKSLRIYKFNMRFAHDKFSQLEMDILFEAYKLPKHLGLHWPPFNLIMLKRLLEMNFINIQQQHNTTIVGGMRVNPDLLHITEKGRTFVDELGLHEI